MFVYGTSVQGGIHYTYMYVYMYEKKERKFPSLALHNGIHNMVIYRWSPAMSLFL
jgi:hypothetical protein